MIYHIVWEIRDDASRVNCEYETKFNYSLCADDEQLDCGMLLQVRDVFFFSSQDKKQVGSREPENLAGARRKGSGQPESLQRVSALTKIPKRRDAQFQS